MITLNIRRRLVLLSLLAATGAAFSVPSAAQAATGDVTVSSPPNVVTVGTGGVQTNLATGLLSPSGVVQDPAGNLFIADSLTGTITKFANGVPTLFASGLSNPQGLALDPNGNLYVANSGGNSVVKITPNGTQTTVAAGLSNPQGLAFDPMGNLLISNAGDNTIAKVSTDGTKSVLVSSGLNSPQGLAVDTSGNLLVANAGGNSIVKVSPDGTTSNLVTSGLNSPQDVALDNLGNLLIANGGTNSILKRAPDGTVTTAASSLTSSPQFLAANQGIHQLLNISTRGVVGTGDNVLIAGFIVRGDAGNGVGSTQVLVRAIGPSLSNAGISTPLADPVLELHDSSGATMATNNNWKDSQQQDIQATGLAPSDDRESAILVNLPDSTYTAVVRGNNNTGGTALVEVYKTQ